MRKGARGQFRCKEKRVMIQRSSHSPINKLRKRWGQNSAYSVAASDHHALAFYVRRSAEGRCWLIDGLVGQGRRWYLSAITPITSKSPTCRECGDVPKAAENIVAGPPGPITPWFYSAFVHLRPSTLAWGKVRVLRRIQQGAPFQSQQSFARRAITRRGRCGPQR